MSATIFSLCQAEYGIDDSAAGARQWERISSTRPARPIATAAQYVAVCRRLARDAIADGRLISVGFRRVPPSEWIRGERRDGRPARRLFDFLAWWSATQDRPNVVGSSYNADPKLAFRLWSAGPLVRRAISRIPVSEWYRVSGPRGLRRRWLRHAAPIGRALRRSTVREVTVSAQALRRLGELSADMQAVAMRGAPQRATEEQANHARSVVVRLRHLDWVGVRRAEQALARDTSGRVAVALAYRDPAGRARRLPEGFVDALDAVCESSVWGGRDRWSAWLCPAYPKATLEQAVRLCLGESPVSISGGQLSRREAHEWLSTAPELTPTEWLTRLLPGAPRVRSTAVARWLLDVHRRGGWGQLTRERDIHGPAGRVVRRALIDVLDEIQDVDLAEGPKTHVDMAFERAAERLARAHEASNPDSDMLLAEPPKWRLYRGMRVLVTPRMLASEGRALGHCVSGYGPAVAAGQCVILSLTVGGHRSTAELSRDGRVYQHRGPSNEEPHPVHQRVLRAFVERRIAS